MKKCKNCGQYDGGLVMPCKITGGHSWYEQISDEKNRGLYKKFHVQKLSNPTKEIDCIVLEFDDPIAQKAIMFWANEMCINGYNLCAQQTKEKLYDLKIRKLKK